MDRADLIKRLKAARALGGFTKPEALVMHPLLMENGIKGSRIRELESMRGRADARPMELAIIARACGLPEEFFSAPFSRMEEPSTGERIKHLEDQVSKMQGDLTLALDALAASRMTRAVRDAGQATGQPDAGSQSGRRATEQP